MPARHYRAGAAAGTGGPKKETGRMWAPDLRGMPEHVHTLRLTDCGECSSMLQAQFRAGEALKRRLAACGSGALSHCLSYVFNEKMIKMPRFRAVVGNQFRLPALAVSVVFDNISEQSNNTGVRCQPNVE